MNTLISPLVGDLILIRTKVRKKSCNLIAQSVLRCRGAEYSHVAIAIDPIFALHSMPAGGVHTVPLYDLITNGSVERFVVFRSLTLEASREFQLKLRRALLYYIDQPYNKTFFARIGDRSSFCSELAAKAYKKSGMPITKKPSRFVLPADLEALSRNAKWRIVTGQYREVQNFMDSVYMPLSLRQTAISLSESINNDAELLLELERRIRQLSLEHPTAADGSWQYWDTASPRRMPRVKV